ncbi:MAG: hypothetical protein IJY74_05365 [Oscillospiraceae bacterium]|nr:hypothetical protein [Oscillospiraceae bacterium]
MEEKDNLIVMVVVATAIVAILYRWLTSKTPPPPPEKPADPCKFCNDDYISVLVYKDDISTREKNERMHATHCPMCGKKIKDPPSE